MNRSGLLLALLALPALVTAQTLDSLDSIKLLKDPLVGLLNNQLGVTENQAKAGIGSMLALAQEKLAKGDFDKIATLVPSGASMCVQTARTLGAVAGPVKDMAGLNGALGRLGMSSETAARFVPAVTDYLGRAGGGTTENLLANVFQ